MELLDLIRSIQTVSMESSINVCDAIVSMIDKNELIKEYDDESIFDDIIMESMMIFMESKNRERDKTPRNEISQWMEEKGYWYTGNNPKKKKECNRMYHFLQQHKFDPKTETYESDIKLKDGSNKRIKLNIDKHTMLEQDDTDRKNIAEMLKLFGKTNKKGKRYIDFSQMSIFDYMEFGNTIQKIEILDLVKKGDNAFYSSDFDDITMGSKTLKGRQIHSQFTLKHEEGHADDFNKSKSRDHADEIRKIKQQANAHNRSKESEGLILNSHDKSSSENYADSYAVKNSRKRTSKNGTTTLSKKDVEKIFKEMDRYLETNGNTIDGCIHTIDEILKVIGNLLTGSWDGSFWISNLDQVKMLVKTRQAVNRQIKIIDEILPSTSNDEALMEVDDETRRKLRQTRLEYEKLSKEYESLKEQYDEEFEDWDNIEFNKQESNTVSSEDLDIMYEKLMGLQQQMRYLEETRDIIDKLISTSPDKLKSKITDDGLNSFITSIKNNRKKTRFNISKHTMPILELPKDILIKVYNESDGDKEKAYGIIKNYYTPSLKRWESKLKKLREKLNKEFRLTNKMKDVSNQIRYEFAVKFVKEYFEYLMEDYDFYMD